MLIFTNPKKELSNTSESYIFQISPKETLQNTASALDTVKTGIELGGETVKQVDIIYDSLKDKSEKSTYETYKTLNKMDKLETLSRQQGINVLDNPEEYMKLAQELGITDYETEVKIYGDSSLGHHGYSHKEQAEIGLNLKNEDDKLKTSEDIRGTTAHELAHQGDTTNTNTESREHFSNTVGNNVSGLVSINDWLYGDGGLNNTSISTYWDNNKQSIQNNNNYVSNLDPSKLEYLDIYSRSLSGSESLYNQNVMVIIASGLIMPVFDNIKYNKILLTHSLSLEHAYGVARIEEKDFDRLTQEHNRTDIKKVVKDGKVEVLISGFPSAEGLSNISGKNDLTISFNDSKDLAYHNDASKHKLIASIEDYNADLKAFEMALVYDSNYKNGLKTTYGLVPAVTDFLTNKDSYNSNSMAISIGVYSGIKIEDFKITGINPGSGKLIPINKFIKPISNKEILEWEK